MKKRVELLAPAGNYEAFLGAVNAGADAVYLGGEKFGARAYADNLRQKRFAGLCMWLILWDVKYILLSIR